jgi:chemotaxis protein methyltransferase CheR
MNESPPEFLAERVAVWAAQRLGFDPRTLRLDRLVEAAEKEIVRLGTLQDLVQALKAGDPGVEESLVAAATVGETYFFRQHEHFDLLNKLPLPDGPLNVWSAGCASGEEAYSLAAALRRQCSLDADSLTVWGTDINARALQKAREAAYGRWSWRQGSGPEWEGPTGLALDPGTRSCVRFARHNLLDEAVFDGRTGERFDLVFCRNVLVYFSPKAALQAIDRLRQCMKPGAWLVLGNMDLRMPPDGMARIGPAALCVYAKVADPAAQEAAPVRASAAPPRRPVPLAAAELDPVEWHRAVLAEMEAGSPQSGLAELEQLNRTFTDYLPGIFEHGLALRRVGRISEAASVLKVFLARAGGMNMGEILPGPEPISVEFYVNGARSFLESAGEQS